MGKQQALSKWTFYIFVQYSLVLNLKYIVQIGFYQTNDGKTTLSFQKFCTMNWVSNTLHKYLKRSYVKFWSRGEQVGKILKIWRKREITDFYLHFTSYSKMTKVNPVKISFKIMILELEKKSSIGMNSHKYLHMHYWLYKCDRKNIISKFSGIYALHFL